MVKGRWVGFSVADSQCGESKATSKRWLTGGAQATQRGVMQVEPSDRISGGFATWGRQRAGWGKAAAGCSSPRGALCVERVAVAFDVLPSVCSF
jgi:hypothetical protein